MPSAYRAQPLQHISSFPLPFCSARPVLLWSSAAPAWFGTTSTQASGRLLSCQLRGAPTLWLRGAVWYVQARVWQHQSLVGPPAVGVRTHSDCAVRAACHWRVRSRGGTPRGPAGVCHPAAAGAVPCPTPAHPCPPCPPLLTPAHPARPCPPTHPSDVEFGRIQARDLLQHLLTGPISNAPVDIVRVSPTRPKYSASTVCVCGGAAPQACFHGGQPTSCRYLFRRCRLHHVCQPNN